MVRSAKGKKYFYKCDLYSVVVLKLVKNRRYIPGSAVVPVEAVKKHKRKLHSKTDCEYFILKVRLKVY